MRTSDGRLSIWTLYGFTLSVAAILLTGCASQSALVDALAKDPASNCIVVTTPYGGILVARATPGTKVNLAGGTCSVDAAPTATPPVQLPVQVVPVPVKP